MARILVVAESPKGGEDPCPLVGFDAVREERRLARAGQRLHLSPSAVRGLAPADRRQSKEDR